jgi:hypothetical protein
VGVSSEGNSWTEKERTMPPFYILVKKFPSKLSARPCATYRALIHSSSSRYKQIVKIYYLSRCPFRIARMPIVLSVYINVKVSSYYLSYIYIYSLFNDAVSSSRYTASNGTVDSKLEKRGRGLSQGIIPEFACREWRGSRKPSSKDSRFPSRYLNPESSECEAGVLATRPRCSVR